MRNKRILAFCASVLVVLSLSPMQASAAENDQDVALHSCPEVGNTYVTATPVNKNYHIGVGPVFRSGPGGTIRVTTSRQYTVGITTNISGNIGTNEIITASISAGVSNATSKSTSTSYAYSHGVSANRYGNVQYGNYGTKVSIKKTTIVSPCNTKVLASGTAIIPSNVWGYRYWES